MDKLKRHLFLRYELKRFLLKSLKKSANLPMTHKYCLFYNFTKLPRLSALPQIVNRCSITGRALSITKKTKYSRFVLRKESYLGNLPGFKRASW